MAWTWLWTVSGFLLLALAFFFRDPRRTPPGDPGVAVSPADGVVVQTDVRRPPESGPDGDLCVAIFLSLFDAHVNRVPADGIVVSVTRQPGSHLHARVKRASENSGSRIVFECGGSRIVVRQIAGLLARRVICRLAPGQSVSRGQRMGIICFGSRAEVYLPGGAELAVVPGQRVKAGVTIIAHLAEKENKNHAICNPSSERAAGPALRTL
jgi:phosphatidylserine decarboxylase